jgi:hypothetical protein
MNEPLLLIVLLSLAASTILNLFLTCKLSAKLRSLLGESEVALNLPKGELLPNIFAHYLIDNRAVKYKNTPMALIFLSSRCSDCKSKLSQILGLIEKLGDTDVQIWLVWSESSATVKPFVANELLLKHSISISISALKEINPRSASPFYLFVDENNILQASGFIGDENWQSFAAQISETEPTQELAS